MACTCVAGTAVHVSFDTDCVYSRNCMHKSQGTGRKVHLEHLYFSHTGTGHGRGCIVPGRSAAVQQHRGTAPTPRPQQPESVHGETQRLSWQLQCQKAPSSRVVGCPETPPKNGISYGEARRRRQAPTLHARRRGPTMIGRCLATADHPKIPSTATTISTAVLATCLQILLKLSPSFCS